MRRKKSLTPINMMAKGEKSGFGKGEGKHRLVEINVPRQGTAPRAGVAPESERSIYILKDQVNQN